MSRRSAIVERHGSGWRVRARLIMEVDGQLVRRVKTMRSGMTHAEALAYRTVLEAMAVDPKAGPRGLTLTEWAAEVFDRRELDGKASVEHDRSRWACHVEQTPLGSRMVREVRRVDVVDWLASVKRRKTLPRTGAARDPGAGRPLSAATVKHCLTVVKLVLQEAVESGILAANPAADVRARVRAKRTEEEWRYVPRDQIATRLAAVPEEHRYLVQFALFTGLRLSEQWSLRWADVVEDERGRHLVVRHGGHGGKSTKGGRVRRVPLLAAAEEALEEAARRHGRTGLVFPGERGPRKTGPQVWWRVARAAAGMPRLRWHDLRHTCATGLLAGWWGRAWSLPEIAQLLGHSDIGVTQRYAHRLGLDLFAAARETALTGSPMGSLPGTGRRADRGAGGEP